MKWQPGGLVKLKTERFVMRSILREDVTEDFLGWLSDREVLLGLNMFQHKLSRPQAVRHVLGFDNRTRFFFIILTRDKDQAIGFFTAECDPVHHNAETSVVIGDHSFWGQNVVLEARTALLDFLFEQVGVHKVLGRPHGRNFASIYNYKAQGFKCEGVLKEQMRSINDDERLDQLIFGMLKQEWAAKKAGDRCDGN